MNHGWDRMLDVGPRKLKATDIHQPVLKVFNTLITGTDGPGGTEFQH